MSGHDPGLEALWRLAGTGVAAVLLVGAFAALSDWRPAGWLLVAGLTVLVVAHVAISVTAYRRTMRREWPQVRPLVDDDDDW